MTQADGAHMPAETRAVDDQNIAVAGKLDDYADLLEQQAADGFRVRAYRRAAELVRGLVRPLDDILAREGREGLVALPAIGTGIAGAIAELIGTGRWSQLERLRGELSPETLFRTIPGIGPKLARRLAEEAQLDSLEDLENALHLGGLRIKGLGERRRRMIAAALAERLGRPAIARRMRAAPRPPVSLILQVDRMYREGAVSFSI